MPDEKMTVKKIVEEFGIGEPIVYKMFKDPKFPAQTYTRPMFILRSEFLKYLTVRHDELCD